MTSECEVIAIGVCTAKRPKMLRDCLDSLISQRLPEGYKVLIIVVDNERQPNNYPIIAATDSPLQIHYSHEPRAGISFARNRVIDEALKLNASWIAFIDDDETADRNWLSALMAPEYIGTPVLMGRRIVTYPDNMPFWANDKPQKPRPEGEFMKTAYTNNVRFSTRILEIGLRFNEALLAMGGEDQEFFTAASRAGFQIRRTLRALTYETAHPERYGYFRQCYQSYWCAASDVRRDALIYSWAGVLARKTHTILSNIVFGAVEVAFSPVFALAGPSMFKRRAVAGGKKIAKGLGRAAGIIGLLPQPYLTIDGK